jgi:RNA polymerase sigma factor (sigma-70 family)
VQKNKIIVEEHINQMYHFFNRQGIRDEDMIQDLVGDTIARLTKTTSYNPEKSAPSTRVQQIMESVLSNYIKTLNRSTDALDKSPLPLDTINNKIDSTNDWRHELLETINQSKKLSKTQKTIMLLKWSDGFLLKDIGARLGLTHDATRQQHKRAITILKREYGEFKEEAHTSGGVA